MSKRLFSLLALSLSLLFFAAAQEAPAYSPEVQNLLDKAIAAHGGEAVLAMQGSQDEVLMSIYAPNGSVSMQLTGNVAVDVSNKQLKSEFLQGETPAMVQVVNSDGAFSSSPQTGTLKLPPALANELEEAFISGVYAFSQLDAYDSISYKGTDTFVDITGERLDFTKGDRVFSRLYDEQGLLIAVQSESSQVGQMITLLSDYREVDGVMRPFKADSYVQGNAFMSLETLSTIINPVFEAGSFELE